MTPFSRSSLEYAKRLRDNQHALAVYDDPRAKWRLVSTYISEAFNQHERALYFCHFENPQDVRFQLKQSGIDTELHEKRGHFRIIEMGDNIRDEKFRSIASQLSDIFIDLATAGGPVRVAGDLTPAIRQGYARQVLKFEQVVGTTPSWPGTVVCACEARTIIDLGRGFFGDLAGTHGHIILRGVAERLLGN